MVAQHREQRRSPRRQKLRSALVLFGYGARSIPCVIWDLSEGGGRLAVAHPTADLPRSFRLLSTTGATVARRCQVVWTDSRFVGVKFV
jgi:hypothetical protein